MFNAITSMASGIDDPELIATSMMARLPLPHPAPSLMHRVGRASKRRQNLENLENLVLYSEPQCC
jgi:hypothetical protein